MNILINGVGAPTPRSIARSLHHYSKYKCNLIGTDINPFVYGLYEKELYSKTYLIPPGNHSDYWESIEKIIKENDIELAIIQPEIEVLEWTRRKRETGKLPCKALLPDFEVVKLLLDKSAMTEVLKDRNLVPVSLNIHRDNIDGDIIKKELGYPFWIRSTSGTSGYGSFKVGDEDSLEKWISINPAVKNFMGSTFLPGRNLACKLLYHNGKLLRSACAERVNYIMSKVAPSGITGNTSFGKLLNEPDLVETAIKAMNIVFEYTGATPHGFYTADFKEDEKGQALITEINVRMVAFNSSFAAGGANFSEDIVSLLTEDPSFDYEYKMYEFEKDMIFLRDVDVEPLLMKESDLFKSKNI